MPQSPCDTEAVVQYPTSLGDHHQTAQIVFLKFIDLLSSEGLYDYAQATDTDVTSMPSSSILSDRLHVVPIR